MFHGLSLLCKEYHAAPSWRANLATLDPDQDNWKFRGDIDSVRGTGCLTKGSVVMVVSLIIWLLIGAIAGWLASLIVKGHGLGLAGNIVVGIVGAVIAGWLLPLIGFVFIGGILAAITNAVIGAVLLLVIIGFVQQKMA
jgi:uncharacterized membrane protein YeaQ/YmgE (transglycosylase-associated protein family)